jgi:hypothetical protein
MALPKITINYLNGLLGAVSDTEDGLLGIVSGATAVQDGFALETPYLLTRFEDLTDLGVTAANNAGLYKVIEDFYQEAEEGTKVVVFGVSSSASKDALCNKTTGKVKDLIISQNGKLKGVVVCNNGGTGTQTAGLAPSLYTAVPVAQDLAEWATTTLYAPLFVIFDAQGYDASKPLTDMTASENNRVAIMLGDTVVGSATSAVGLLAGRIAAISVQRNVGRVKDGALVPSTMFIGAKKIEEANTVIADAYDKGYIIPRKYVGRAGYFFADDQMACDPTDDYAHIALRRTVDKAYRIAYNTLLDYMLDEIEINKDGTMQIAVIKSWQSAVEGAINRQMTANGELSGGDEGGCECYIDPTQNVLSSSKVHLVLKVRPYGYARQIEVDLGFLVTNNS